MAKILVEFSLTTESRSKVQHFFDRHFDNLKSSDPVKAKEAADTLKELLSGGKVLPPQAVEALHEVLDGKSDMGWLIHNFPERRGFEHINKAPKPEDTYSYHIGRALYELNKARYVHCAPGKRESHKSSKSWRLPGLQVHRDSLQMPSTVGDMATYGEYIIFTCPYNAECAPTDIIQLRRAITQLPPDVREKVMVQIHDRALDGYEFEAIEPGNLDSLLKALDKFPPPHEYYVKEVALVSDPELPETKAFLEEVKKCSIQPILQPGDLLLINEHNMFHRSLDGDPAKIAHIPPTQPLSRIIMHHAGTRQPPSNTL